MPSRCVKMNQESEGTGGTDLGEGCKEKQEGILEVHWPEQKDQGEFPPLINQEGELVTADMQKAEVLNFASVFTASQASQVFVS